MPRLDSALGSELMSNFWTSKNQLSKAAKKALRAAGIQLAAAGQPQAIANLRARAKAGGFATDGKRAVMHLPTTRGNNGVVVSAPQALGRRMQTEWTVTNGSRRGSLRVRGQDWLGRIAASASEVPGFVYLEIYINPLEIAGTRLSLFAQLYDKFLFGLLKFHFVPAGSTQTRGTIIMAYDRDISDTTPPLGDNGVRQFISMMDAVSTPIWAPATAVCPLSHPAGDGLWTNPVAGGDDRLSYQGQLYVACMEPSSLTAGQSLGDIFMEYDVEFYDPQLDATSPAAINYTTGYGGAGATTDALRAFVPGTLGTVNSGTVGLYPKLLQDGRSALQLAQGVYRLLNLTDATVGAVQYAAPVVVPNVPKAAPAPQPIIYPVSNIGADPSGTGPAMAEFFVAVPPGGGDLFWNFAANTGVASVSDQKGTFEKISPNWFDPAQMFV